jgi:hypothetical protein
VTRLTLAHEDADALVGQNALAHGKALLVVAACDGEKGSGGGFVLSSVRTSDLEDVALPLLAQRIGRHLRRHALLQEGAEGRVVLNVQQLLRAVRRIGNVELLEGERRGSMRKRA